MKVIEIIGKSNTGKTVLIEDLIRKLKADGIKVGSIKKSFHHNVEYDKEGKDTYRMEQAGSSITGGFSKESAFLYFKFPVKPLDFIKNFSSLDIVLIEGEMGFAAPKIYCLGEDPIPEDPLIFALFSFKGDNPNKAEFPTYTLESLSDLAHEIRTKVPEFLPQLNCGNCGFDCEGLLSRILWGESDIKDCKVLFGTKCKVSIDGQSIELMPFLDKMLENIIKGFLTPLKGYRKGKINIEIEG
jgi:molybdopterin-guanine dinucleotide biosynthesis protein B